MLVVQPRLAQLWAPQQALMIAVATVRVQNDFVHNFAAAYTNC
jgi:hypothetical protein